MDRNFPLSNVAWVQAHVPIVEGYLSESAFLLDVASKADSASPNHWMLPAPLRVVYERREVTCLFKEAFMKLEQRGIRLEMRKFLPSDLELFVITSDYLATIDYLQASICLLIRKLIDDAIFSKVMLAM